MFRTKPKIRTLLLQEKGSDFVSLVREKVKEIAPNALNYDVFRIELAQTATKIKST